MLVIIHSSSIILPVYLKLLWMQKLLPRKLLLFCGLGNQADVDPVSSATQNHFMSRDSKEANGEILGPSN